MPTRSPGLIPSAATPAALGSAAPSSARAVYLQQKRTHTARRGAEIIGAGLAGLAVPLITYGDALELVAWWSRNVPALASCLDAGACDPEVGEWARCALAARALASGPVAAGAGGGLYPDRFRLWKCIKRIALAMDTRNVSAPSWSAAVDSARSVGELVKAATTTAADAKNGADDAAHAVGVVSDALAVGAAKVSAAAGRGAGTGAIVGALSAAKVPAAIAGVALVGGLVLWRVSRAESRNDNRAASSSTARKAKQAKRTKSGGRS